MPDINPARNIAVLLESAKTKSSDVAPYLQAVLSLNNKGAFESLNTVRSLGNTLDWLSEVVETTPSIRPKEAVRYRDACEQVKRRLDWEFGERHGSRFGERHERHGNRAEPKLNLDALTERFEMLAEELDEAVTFAEVKNSDVQEWLTTVDELIASISGSDLDHDAKKLLLDATQALRKSIVDLDSFGAAACSESLNDALGRIVGANLKVKESAEGQSKVKRLWALFALLAGVVSTVSKLQELPEVIHKGIEMKQEIREHGLIHSLTAGDEAHDKDAK